VSSKVGGPGEAMMAAISAHCSAMPTAKASSKCSSRIAAKSGKP
jgi:hypothetical protein